MNAQATVSTVEAVMKLEVQTLFICHSTPEERGSVTFKILALRCVGIAEKSLHANDQLDPSTTLDRIPTCDRQTQGIASTCSSIASIARVKK